MAGTVLATIVARAQAACGHLVEIPARRSHAQLIARATEPPISVAALVRSEYPRSYGLGETVTDLVSTAGDGRTSTPVVRPEWARVAPGRRFAGPFADAVNGQGHARGDQP